METWQIVLIVIAIIVIGALKLYVFNKIRANKKNKAKIDDEND
ncbi:MAG: hypothetical protein PHP11_01860 [Erysipelotrichaceae bacterium]|nr:hypothetical protein [Erysipelotrichaceae bacterium]MDD3923832.1 hypothetical protein [Erysipelotrichaceae bacterium]MDD4642373.1 hypothetical protein [Erysipelotrichaceae bacterium]